MEHALETIFMYLIWRIFTSNVLIIYLKKKSITLNCGYGKGYSVQEVVNIFKKIKKNCKVLYEKRRPGDIDQVYANTKKKKNT